MDLKTIVSKLEAVPGLHSVRVLHEEEKERILGLEEERNLGVWACLGREHTLALFHDSSFREPAGPIVMKMGDDIFFPAVPFPEVKAHRVVSSSPGAAADRFLREEVYHDIVIPPEDASLLIGFD